MSNTENDREIEKGEKKMRLLEAGLLFGRPTTNSAGATLTAGTMEYALSHTIGDFGRSCANQISTQRYGETDSSVVFSRFPGLTATGESARPENCEKYFSSLFPKCMQSNSKPEMKELASGLAGLLAQGEVLRVNKISISYMLFCHKINACVLHASIYLRCIWLTLWKRSSVWTRGKN